MSEASVVVGLHGAGLRGDVKDTKVYQVQIGPDGKPQKTEICNGQAQPSGRQGRLKKDIVAVSHPEDIRRFRSGHPPSPFPTASGIEDTQPAGSRSAVFHSLPLTIERTNPESSVRFCLSA
jgi:hypothetical protein